ncbi:MAG: hypothetical protein JW723_05515 [Bacteroidales bacterium]|nr:hypothetical protein [Bacteroidales bacterium]
MPAHKQCIEKKYLSFRALLKVPSPLPVAVTLNFDSGTVYFSVQSPIKN